MALLVAVLLSAVLELPEAALLPADEAAVFSLSAGGALILGGGSALLPFAFGGLGAARALAGADGRGRGNILRTAGGEGEGRGDRGENCGDFLIEHEIFLLAVFQVLLHVDFALHPSYRAGRGAS